MSPNRGSARPGGATAKRRRPPGRESDATRIRRRFEQLLTAGLAIYEERSVPELLQRVVDAAREVVGARYAALGILDQGSERLIQFVTSGITPAAARRIGDLPRGRGLLGLVVSAGQPIRTADIARHPKRAGFPAHHPAMTSFLGVPILSHGRAFGNLYLTDKIDAAEFDAEDEALAVLLAAQAAVAVENAQLHEESQALVGQVRAMQRQRDLFFAMMNHELRNSLTGVYGWAERLVRRRPGDQMQAAREVFDGAERTITLLNNFLDLTRLDAGKVMPVWREVQVRTAVARAIAGLVPMAEAKNVTIEQQYIGPEAALHTDGMRLEQILVNLLSNGVRHSPEGEPVVLRVRGATDAVIFEVCDRGPGIPEDQREKIFEPFERFDPHSGMGSGLGLPLSRRLAEILGGRLDVECPPAGGAIFRLWLPRTPPPDV